MIRVAAAAAGLRSLNHLCKVARVDRSTLRWACDGTRRPTASTIGRLASALEMTADAVGAIFAAARKVRSC